MDTNEVLALWPSESREAAQLVIEKYGQPHEVTGSRLEWFEVGPWKRVMATREFWEHRFPAPHFDSIESVIDYRVPAECFSQLAEFDGSVVARRTMGEISATCHDEEANCLALNLAHDIVTGDRSPENARAYYSKEFLDARRKLPTPYMAGLRFATGDQTVDPDVETLTQADLDEAQRQGE